jgi:hypothetical protein
VSWQTHPAATRALELSEHLIRTDADPAYFDGRVSAVRRAIKESSAESDFQKRACAIAAYGMIAGGMVPNAGDVAWFVRDLTIGYPQRPSFPLNDGLDASPKVP